MHTQTALFHLAGSVLGRLRDLPKYCSPLFNLKETYSQTLSKSYSYSYNALNQLVSVTTDFGAFQKTIGYSYYPNGLKKSYTNPEGISYRKPGQIYLNHLFKPCFPVRGATAILGRAKPRQIYFKWS
tara:strand:+ start:1058 stop:1438 length:381 start_codon:yes stop_codon:yes gene_type:complete